MTGLKCLKFYENWWMMAESRDTAEKRLAFYDAIMRYAFSGEVPEQPERGSSPGVVWAAWDGYLAAKPVIDGVMEREDKVFAGKIGGMAGFGASKARYGKRAVESQAGLQAGSQADLQADLQAPDASRNASTLLIKDKDNIKDKEKDKDNNNTGGAGVPTDDEKTMIEAWWKAYPGPRKTDKKKCFEKFVRILRKSKDAVSMFNRMMDGLARWKKCDTWTRDNGQYIRAPMVWLNNENWNDAPESTRPSSGVANIHHIDSVEVEDAF